MVDRCKVKGCRHEGCIRYYGRPVCWRCWSRHCDKDDTFELKTEFKIKEAE